MRLHIQLCLNPKMSSIVLLSLLPISSISVLANENHSSNAENSAIAAPDNKFRGLSYSEWAVEWFRYANSLPLAHHPLNDTGDCSVGQKGNVWFIDGPLANPYPAEGRDCTIPPGTALFFALKANSWDNEACDADIIHKSNYTTEQLRSNAFNDLIVNYGLRKIILDGKEISGLPTTCDPANPVSCQSPYLIQTPVFDYTIPALDNTLILFNGACYNNPNHDRPYIVNGTVGNGYFVMFKPLSVGNHTLQFGKLDASGIPTRLYRIKVSPNGHYEHKHGKRGFD